MTNVFNLDGRDYTVSDCTAIAFVDGTENESDRQNALFVSTVTDGGESVEHVVFGWEMPKTDEDFADMCEDYNSWDSDYDTLETVREKN